MMLNPLDRGLSQFMKAFFFSDGVGGVVGDKGVFVTPAHPFLCWLPYHAAVLIIFLLLQGNYLEKPLRS